MNRIKIQKVMTQYGYEEKYWSVDEKVLPYYETEGNVCWFQDLNWCFGRAEYETMVREFWERTTLEHLQNILKQDNNSKLNVTDCAILIADMVTEPLLKLFDRCDENALMIDCYISLIEIMWEKGDKAVRNVVDVTILERLSDEDTVWQRFGELISSEFKCYINQVVLTTSLMMCGVRQLE